MRHNITLYLAVVSLLLSSLFSCPAVARGKHEKKDSLDFYADARFKPALLIAPAALITLGSVGVNHFGRSKDNVRNFFGKRHHTYADDYVQYLPIASVYGLSLLGAKAKHDYVDRTMVLAVSAATMAAVVNVVKHTVKEKRPDSGARNSFPSGHTATAFLGAEIVREEYGWGYGAAAYGVAALIGVSRMWNDRHWYNDVLAGAGVGILSARVGYWLLPYTTRIFKHKRRGADKSMAFTAFSDGRGGGATMVLRF